MVRILFLPELAVAESDDDLMALDTDLERLNNQAPVKAELIKLSYFSGLRMAEAAAFLNISVATAERYWAYSRAWLHQEVIRVRDESA
ncbi:MAG: ECF-type sigma factor [Fuerstiella sp.]|nr:ECF-type sigma factor [Fuerstiella sp.]